MINSVAEQIGRDTMDAVMCDFYAKIRAHAQLAPIFAVVQDWPQHEAHIAHFWWVLLGGEAYLDAGYNVARKHVGIGVTPALVDEWLRLFQSVLLCHVSAPLAEAWLAKARMIGQSIALMNTPLDGMVP